MDVEENIWMRHLEMSASKPMLDKIDDELRGVVHDEQSNYLRNLLGIP
jgi:hypothetical protein